MNVAARGSRPAQQLIEVALSADERGHTDTSTQASGGHEARTAASLLKTWMIASSA
jgi:hypothetical protein